MKIDYFSQLPDECVFYLLDYFRVVDLARLRQTCTQLRDMTSAYIEHYMTAFEFTGIPKPSYDCFDDRSTDSIESFHIDQGFDNLEDCNRKRGVAPFKFTREVFLSFVRERTNIQVFRIEGEELISAAQIDDVVLRNKDLLILVMADTDRAVTDSFVLNVFKTCTKLKQLSIPYTRSLSDEAFPEGMPVHTQLTHLDVEGARLSAVGFFLLSRAVPNLQHLNVSCCGNFCDMSVKAFIEKCKGLRSFNMNRCYKVTDITIFQVGKALPLLEKLELVDVNQLTDFSIIQLSKEAKILKCINLSCCTLITDDSIMSLVTYCQKLEFLAVAQCRRLTDRAIEGIAKKATRLKELHMQSCGISRDSLLTDSSICQLVKCPRLELVNFSYCPTVTNKSRDALDARGIKYLPPR